VFVGDNVPDLRFFSCALTRPVAPRTLAALEYSTIRRIGNGGAPTSGRQVAAGLVYGERVGWTYSAELSYVLDSKPVKWHTTLAVAVVF